MIIMGNQSLSLLGFLGDLLGGFLGWSLGLLGGLLWGSLWCGLLGDFLCCGFGYRKDRLDIIHEKSWYDFASSYLSLEYSSLPLSQAEHQVKPACHGLRGQRQSLRVVTLKCWSVNLPI